MSHDGRAPASLGLLDAPVAGLLFVLGLAVALYLLWDWPIGWAGIGS